VTAPIGRRVAVLAATRLDPDSRQHWMATIKNVGSGPVYLGGSAVATTDGYQLDPYDIIEVQLGPSNLGLYAIASAEQTLHILETST
jgi:hypothetical protein